MARCDTEIDILKNEIDQDIWTFRWVWLVNLAAIIWGAVMHHWDIVVISAISAAIALVGIGRTRRDRHTVDRVADVCIPRQEEK